MPPPSSEATLFSIVLPEIVTPSPPSILIPAPEPLTLLLLMVLPCGKVGAVPMIPTLEPTETTAESPIKTNSLPLMLLFCTLFDSSTPLPPTCAQGHR